MPVVPLDPNRPPAVVEVVVLLVVLFTPEPKILPLPVFELFALLPNPRNVDLLLELPNPLNPVEVEVDPKGGLVLLVLLLLLFPKAEPNNGPVPLPALLLLLLAPKENISQRYYRLMKNYLFVCFLE